MDLLNESQTRIGRRDKTLREIEESGIQLAEYIDRRNREDEETLEQFAKEQDKWIDDVDEYLAEKYGEKVSSGSEAFVYRYKKNVIKSRSFVGYNSIREALKSIEIHNNLFPSTAYQVVGFGRSDNELTVILQQPYIEGVWATNDQIEQYVKEYFGANKDHSVIGGTSYKNDSYLIQDLKPKNVIVRYNKQKELTLFVIDGDFYINSEIKKD